LQLYYLAGRGKAALNLSTNCTLRGMVAEMERQLDRATLNDQISRFVLFADGDAD
jgi:hypothetical protein